MKKKICGSEILFSKLHKTPQFNTILNNEFQFKFCFSNTTPNNSFLCFKLMKQITGSGYVENFFILCFFF